MLVAHRTLERESGPAGARDPEPRALRRAREPPVADRDLRDQPEHAGAQGGAAGLHAGRRSRPARSKSRARKPRRSCGAKRSTSSAYRAVAKSCGRCISRRRTPTRSARSSTRCSSAAARAAEPARDEGNRSRASARRHREARTDRAGRARPRSKTIYATDKDPAIKRAVLNAFFVQGNAKALIEIAKQETGPRPEARGRSRSCRSWDRRKRPSTSWSCSNEAAIHLRHRPLPVADPARRRHGHVDGADGGGAVCRRRGASALDDADAQGSAPARPRRRRFAPHGSSGAMRQSSLSNDGDRHRHAPRPARSGWRGRRPRSGRRRTMAASDPGTREVNRCVLDDDGNFRDSGGVDEPSERSSSSRAGEPLDRSRRTCGLALHRRRRRQDGVLARARRAGTRASRCSPSLVRQEAADKRPGTTTSTVADHTGASMRSCARADRRSVSRSRARGIRRRRPTRAGCAATPPSGSAPRAARGGRQLSSASPGPIRTTGFAST